MLVSSSVFTAFELYGSCWPTPDLEPVVRRRNDRRTRYEFEGIVPIPFLAIYDPAQQGVDVGGSHIHAGARRYRRARLRCQCWHVLFSPAHPLREGTGRIRTFQVKGARHAGAPESHDAFSRDAPSGYRPCPECRHPSW